MSSIAGLGNFTYDGDGNETSLTSPQNIILRQTSWTSFDMPFQITAGSNSSQFVYGPEHQRSRQIKGDGSTIVYAGGMEVDISASQAATVKTYWPMGLGVEIDAPNTATVLYWTHTDKLGSVIAMSDQNGVLQQTMSYDAWGMRRNTNGVGTPSNLNPPDSTGYTGQEMLDQLNLGHMNGRVYDPNIARFMSADPFIQKPSYSQSYNRYAYVWNNPTRRTDPSGFDGEDGGGDGSNSGGDNSGQDQGGTPSNQQVYGYFNAQGEGGIVVENINVAPGSLLVWRLCSDRKATTATDVTNILRTLMRLAGVDSLCALEMRLCGALNRSNEQRLVKYWNSRRPGGGGNMIKPDPPQMMKIKTARALLQQAHAAGIWKDENSLGRALICLDREELLGRVAKIWKGLKRPSSSEQINWYEVLKIAQAEADKIESEFKIVRTAADNIEREHCAWRRSLVGTALAARRNSDNIEEWLGEYIEARETIVPIKVTPISSVDPNGNTHFFQIGADLISFAKSMVNENTVKSP